MLLTGINIPAELGYHYGPKPKPEVAAFLNGETLFSKCVKAGKKSELLNAYPHVILMASIRANVYIRPFRWQ